MELIIDKVKYSYPERLTIEQWQWVMQYDFQLPTNWPTLIAYLTGAPKSMLERGSQDALELGAAIIVQLCNARQPIRIKPVTDLNFGEFIDMDTWAAMGIKDHLKDMAQMLCETKWADEALWAVEQWVQYRTHIFRQYAELFGLYEGEEEDEPVAPQKVDRLQVARNWYKVIVDLANDDLLKLDAVTEEPLIKTLNFMALRKQKQLEENMKIMEQNMKLKTHR